MRPKGFNPGVGSRGNANIEFALCAIFMVFLLISIVDMARGLWIQHTLTEAVRDAARFAIVRGEQYKDPNTNVRLLGATLGNVRDIVVKEAVGLVPAQMDLVFEVSAVGVSGTAASLSKITCNPADGTDCGGVSLTSHWPPDGLANSSLEVAVTARYPYNSMVVMYFPGGKGINFGQYVLGSTARERIVF